MATKTVDLGLVVGPKGDKGDAGPQGPPPPVTAVAVTLKSASWSGSGPYTQSAAVSGLTAAQHGFAQVSQNATQAQRLAACDALLSVTGQAAGSLTFTADGDRPTIDIPVSVLLLG